MRTIPLWLEYIGSIGFPLSTIAVLVFQGLRFNKTYLPALKPHVRTDPPYSYPPAVLGCLWKFGKVTLADLSSTILDLAERGHLTIWEERKREEKMFGHEINYDYYFKTEKQRDRLSAYETSVYDFVRDLESKNANSLQKLENFMTKNPAWFTTFFLRWSKQVKKDSKSYRRVGDSEGQLIAITYLFGGGLAILSIILLLLGMSTWPIPLLVGVAEALWAYYSATKNAMGSEEFLEWSAYRKYLLGLASEDSAPPESWEDTFIDGVVLGAYSAVLEGWRRAIPRDTNLEGQMLITSDGGGLHYLSGLGNLTNSINRLTPDGEKMLEMFTGGRFQIS